MSTAHRRNSILLPACALFGAALAAFGLCQDSPGNILAGLRTIVTMEDVLITDYIAVAGMGAAFVNAGLVTLISTAILWLVKDPINGATLVTIGLMSGFSLFGKNIANIWPILAGTALYALLKGETLAHHVNVALRTTSLSPVVSFMAVRYSPWLGVAIGVLIGFLMPPVAEHAHRVQNGMNLYSLGFSCGLLAMMLVPAFKAFGLSPASAHYWSTGNNLKLGLALGGLCLTFIALGLSRSPRRVLKKYWLLLRTSGRVPSDYVRTFTPGPVLVNMGVNGLVATGYVLLIGGDLMQALFFAIFVLALQQFDGNILGPAILGQSTGLSAMWVVFAILLFGGLYGFVGMIIGVPLLAVIFGVLRGIVNALLRKKGLSTDSRDYASSQHPYP